LLSSSSITGGNLQVSVNIEDYYKRIRAMQLKNPAIIGFGISDHKSFSKACEYAAGAIVGSAFVKLLGTEGYLEKVPGFVNTIRPSY
jgi:tryptophan synthase alpha chain